MAASAAAAAAAARESPVLFRRALVARIGALGSAAHEEIFHMLTERGGAHFTRNNYGIHVNLSPVHDDLIGDISAYVDYCVSKDDDLREDDRRLDEYKFRRRGVLLSSPDQMAKNDNNNIITSAAVQRVDHRQQHDDDVDAAAGGGDGPPAAAAAAGTWGGKLHLCPEETRRLAEALDLELAPDKRRACSTKFALAKKRFARRRPAPPTTVTMSSIDSYDAAAERLEQRPLEPEDVSTCV